jgi:uncharacterized membrane protein YgdD (TMEM256/DUF423 family)
LILKQSTVTFGVLAAAFAISALYQLYRVALMEVPEYDVFTPATGAAFLGSIGISALVLTDRRWAWWVVSALVLDLLALGVLWYYPVVATAREMGFVDWLEGSLYMGLLFVAGFLYTLKLLGARLLPEKG